MKFENCLNNICPVLIEGESGVGKSVLVKNYRLAQGVFSTHETNA